MNKKGINGFQILLGLTVTVVALSSVIGAIMLHNVPSRRETGSVLIVVSAAGILLLLLEAFISRNQAMKYISKMSTMISKTERDSLLNFPAPAAIIDSENVIVWYNKLFGRQVYTAEEVYGVCLTDIVNINMDDAYTMDGCQICLEKKYYIAKAIHTDAESGLSMVYFNDVTDYTELKYDTYQSHNAVIIIMIDNFDDLMSNIRESEKAHVVVDIEKLMEQFLDGTTGIAKKVSNDKFYVFMEERYLAKKIENRFAILEKAREIKVGGKSNITLSIGVGREGKGLEECEKLAKQALELCQGRGGDQAAVRENGEFKFFGGVSNAADNNNRVKIRLFAETLLEVIHPGSVESIRNFRNDDDDSAGFRKVIIMGHRFGDLDSVGSATGLCCALRKIVSDCWVAVDMEKNLAQNLVNYIQEKESENYYITPNEAYAKMDSNTLLIIVDTHNPELVESKEILSVAKNIVVIDHHRRMVNGIEPLIASCLEPGASSAAELVTEIIEYLGDKTDITVHAAEALLAGIMLDTKNFVMKTGVTTFETAAFLKKKGADTISVKKMFGNNIETYHQKSSLINSAKIYKGCAVASTTEDFSDIRIAASQAADELLGITGVVASFVMYQQNGIINISARSMGEFNVQIVMEALGGGGHLTMAATQMKTTMSEAKKQLHDAIDEYIKNNTK